jgi:OmpA-OmpF porin, OOP family
LRRTFAPVNLRSMILCAMVMCAVPSLASAQAIVESGWALDRYNPAPAGERFAIAEHPVYARRWDVNAALTFEYARSPLTVSRQYADLQVRSVSVVGSMLVTHLAASASFMNRFGVDVQLPLSLAQIGSEALLGNVALAPASEVAVGDLRLGARVRVLGDSMTSPVSVHLGVWGWVPSGSRIDNTGDGQFRFEPRVILSGSADVFRWSLVANVSLRRGFEAANVAVGNEARVTAAAGVDLLRNKLRVGVESYVFTSLGSVPGTTTRAFFAPGHWGGETMGTANVLLNDGVSFGIGAGFGFERGVGVPTGRAMLMVSWHGTSSQSGVSQGH